MTSDQSKSVDPSAIEALREAIKNVTIKLTHHEYILLKAIYLADYDALERYQTEWQYGVGPEGHSGDYSYHLIYLRRLGFIESEYDDPLQITEQGRNHMMTYGDENVSQ